MKYGLVMFIEHNIIGVMEPPYPVVLKQNLIKISWSFKG